MTAVFRYTLHTLGPLQLHSVETGASIRLRREQRALLAWLAADSPQPRSALMETFCAQAQAQTTLRRFARQINDADVLAQFMAYPLNARIETAVAAQQITWIGNRFGNT